MSALQKQEGGGHYKDYAIQPVEFIHANRIPYLEANVIKYVVRHKKKNGVEDLLKAKHYIEMLIELEYGQERKGDAAGGDTCPGESGRGTDNEIARRC